MKLYTLATITKLPLSWREKQNKNRNRKGFHVYLSRFFLDFGLLSEGEKIEFLADVLKDTPAVGAVYMQEMDDDASFNSTDLPLYIWHQHVMKAAVIIWNSSSENIQESWGQQAAFLNTLPVIGRLNNIPGTRDTLEDNMISAMFLDWKSMCRRIHSSIKNRGRSDVIATKSYKFGKKDVMIQS